jgi:iron-sulfur cluster assembly accessory protein
VVKLKYLFSNKLKEQNTMSCSNKQTQNTSSSTCCNATKTSCCDTTKDYASSTAKNIHRQMTIEEILSMFPYKAQRLSQEITNAGLHCVGCQAATWETLEAGMFSHGMNDEAINKLVNRLNALLEEKIDTSTITITKRAATKYLEILADEGKQGWGLRFAEKMAGCNGFEYALDYSEKGLPDDTTFESLGIQIHVNNGMVKKLIGSEIDFVDGLQGSGFKVSNPNVKSSCGCGTSHGY